MSLVLFVSQSRSGAGKSTFIESNDTSEVSITPERTIDKASEFITKYWRSSINETNNTKDIYEFVGKLSPPRRLKIVGWRVSNWGMRTYDAKFPQLVPSTTFGKLLKLPRDILLSQSASDRYLNYSKFVRLRIITVEEIDTLDFCYIIDRNNQFVMSEPVIGGLIVENPQVMRGFSSLCTSAHSAYGFARTAMDLIVQKRRELETKAGGS